MIADESGGIQSAAGAGSRGQNSLWFIIRKRRKKFARD
jgi:hypothetical protein